MMDSVNNKNFDASEFNFSEIVNVTKELIVNKFYKLTINNIDYVILISRIRATYMEFSILTRNQQMNTNNPIEYEIINFYQELGRTIDIFNYETFYYYSYSDIFEKYIFKLLELNDIGVDFINELYQNNELITLISGHIDLKSLEKPTTSFEKKISDFILEISLKKINNNRNLQKKLIEQKERNENKKKELEEHMKTVREKEKKIQEFNNEMKIYPSKNSSSYNIRW